MIDWENKLRGKDTEESWGILESVVKESVERNIPMQKVVKTYEVDDTRGAECGEGETQSIQEIQKAKDK